MLCSLQTTLLQMAYLRSIFIATKINLKNLDYYFFLVSQFGFPNTGSLSATKQYAA